MVCVHRTRPISHVIGARPRGTSGRARPTADRGNTRSPRPAPAAPPGRPARQESLKGEGTLVSEKNDKKRRGLRPLVAGIVAAATMPATRGLSPRRFLSFFSETNVPSPFRDSCLAGRPGGAAGAGRGERVFPRSAVGRARPDVPRGRAPITCDIGRVRCTHTMEPPSGGRRFGHPPGMGRAPRRMPRGPERGEGTGGNQPMGQKPPEAHDSFVVTRSSQS